MSTEDGLPYLEVSSAVEWRNWLDKHHGRSEGVWLVFFKVHTGVPCASYEESVEEALCFGWVDSLVRSLDERRYAQKFTPRKANSNWSASNRKRVRRLIAEGRMTEAGMARVEAAKRAGKWKDHEPPPVSVKAPPELTARLKGKDDARAFYESLTRRQREQFHAWINQAKRPETRERRLARTLAMLDAGEKPGMF